LSNIPTSAAIHVCLQFLVHVSDIFQTLKSHFFTYFHPAVAGAISLGKQVFFLQVFFPTSTQDVGKVKVMAAVSPS